MLAVYKRELRTYLNTVIGFLFVAANLFLIGLYFVVYNLYYDYPYFQYAIQSCGILMLISVPVLTMRMLAEERKNKTDQLLLTAPVPLVKVVLGKYLAALTVFAIPCIVSCIYPLIMTRFGAIGWGESYLGILGFFLFGAACIAIGTFISSLFENQIVAAVVCFVALFVGFMMSSLCRLISSSGNILTNILLYYDIDTPFNSFMSGTIDLTAVVYFLTITALFLYLTVQSIQKRRYSISVKHFSLGAYSLIGILVSIVLFAGINFGVKKIPAAYTSFDLTYNKMYTLTEETKKYLKEINEDINIYVFAAESDYDETVAKTLNEYAGASGHIKVSYVDPSVNPRFYANYTSSAPTSGSIFVESSKRSKVVDYNSLYEQTYSMNYNTYSYDSEIVGYDAEGQITGAIDYCLTDDMPKMYIISGHGEAELDESYEAALTKANMDHETINLMNYDSIPEGAGCVLLNGPVGDLSSDDLEKLLGYLRRGGKIILTLSLTDEEQPNLGKLMSEMELELNRGVLIEADADYMYGSPLFEIPEIYASDQTAEVYGSGYNVFAPYNTGIIVSEEDDENVITDIFLESSTSSYLKIDYMNMTDDAKEEGDIDGPFPIGVSVIKTFMSDDEGNLLSSEEVTEDGETEAAVVYTDGEMVVYSAVTMFTEAADSMVSNANQKIFISTVGKYMGKENSVSIPSKSYDLGYLTTTLGQILAVAIIAVVVVPIALLVCGIIIWARRRKL